MVMSPMYELSDNAQTEIASTDDAKVIKIEATNVSVFYSEKQALNNVSVDIEDRAVTAFIGPSGCGKSTFLRCFNRMNDVCLLYTSPSPRDVEESRMPSSA